jgi:RimJ/RimL family protein N-acetyltransferase
MNNNDNKNDSGSNAKDRTIFLKGKKTILRPFEDKDAERCCRWVNDPEVAQYISNHWPMTVTEEAKWIADMSSGKRTGFGLAIETHDGIHIGNMGVHKINWIDGTAETGALIGEKEYWGKGYGTDAKMQLLNHLFNTLNLRKICSAALAFNARSIAYSLHCGYMEEGRRKKHVFRNGAYHDIVDLALFKEDWLPYWEAYQSSENNAS